VWLDIQPESNFNILEKFTNTFSRFAKENLMNIEGRGEKLSVFI